MPFGLLNCKILLQNCTDSKPNLVLKEQSDKVDRVSHFGSRVSSSGHICEEMISLTQKTGLGLAILGFYGVAITSGYRS